MTSPLIKVKIIRRVVAKTKALVRYVSRLVGGDGISVTTANGIATIDMDYEEIQEALAVPDVEEDFNYLAYWNSTSGQMSRINFTNFKADIVASFDEIYAAESITLTAGAGLTGGGDLSANRSFAVGAGTGITVNADDVALDTANTRNTDHASVTLSAGAGMSGGGDITANRSFAVGAGTGITVNADDVALDTASTRNTDHAGVTLTAGAGLSGGGDITTNRSFAVGAGAGITVNADDVALSAIDDDRLLANISGGSAAPSANTLTAILDAILGNTQGDILYRNATVWAVLPKGSDGDFLKSTSTTISWDAVPGGGDMLAANNLSDVADERASRQNIGVYKKGSDVASASTIDLTATVSDLVDVTGTTTITAVTLSEGDEKVVRFTGSLIITHGASLILPNSANITTRDGDYAVFRGYGSGVVRMVDFMPKARPLFRARIGSSQTINHNTATKLTFSSEIYDNNANYDNATNYRFTPTVPGYYRVSVSIVLQGTSGRSYVMTCSIYKNGVSDLSSEYGAVANAGQSMPVEASQIMFLNGSTDYIEAYAYQFDFTASSTALAVSGNSVFEAEYIGPN